MLWQVLAEWQVQAGDNVLGLVSEVCKVQSELSIWHFRERQVVQSPVEAWDMSGGGQWSTHCQLDAVRTFPERPSHLKGDARGSSGSLLDDEAVQLSYIHHPILIRSSLLKAPASPISCIFR